MRLLRAALVLVVACAPVVFVAPPASALSCIYGWSEPDARKMMATSTSFFTGTVVRIDRSDRGFERIGEDTRSRYDDVANVVTFDVRSVWKGRDLHARHVVGFNILWADDLRPGRAYHVAVDERGVSGPCSFVPVASAQGFHPHEPRPPIERQVAASAPRSVAVRQVDAEPDRRPWLIGGGLLVLAVAIAVGHRRRTSWN